MMLLYSGDQQRKGELDHEERELVDNFLKATSFAQEFVFNSKLWLCGMKIGRVTGRFRLLNFPFLQ